MSEQSYMKKRSFRIQLFISICLVAIIPVIVISSFSLGNTIRIVSDKVNELTKNNLDQVDKNINITLEGYGDLLFQLCTDDSIIDLVEKIHSNKNVEFYKSQLIRRFHEVSRIKTGLISVMLITKGGDSVFYDKLTSATTRSSWLQNYSLSLDGIFNQIKNSNQIVTLSTEYASTIAGKPYYLFHKGHRIIDYKDVEKEIGVIVFSINEEVLKQICNAKSDGTEYMDSITFIVDKNQKILSYPDNKNIGDIVVRSMDRKKDYKSFVEGTNVLKDRKLAINYVMDQKSGWSVVNAMDYEILLKEIQAQRTITGIIILCSFIILVVISGFLSSYLTASIQKVVKVMKKISSGERKARVLPDRKMPEEIQVIARQLNDTMDQLQDSMEQERIAKEKQKDAEIKFLEAQINPHFIYNTLDTINWLAIDEEQYEISNAINSLANILRYGIEGNYKLVPISKEIDWLKKYLFLQQARVKKRILCTIKIEPQLKNCYIYKLLLQPFIENAVIHGFRKEQEELELKVTIEESDEKLHITIADNGRGIKEEVLNEIKYGTMEGHIGILNAIERIKMYYGEEATVEIKSVLDEGTEVIIHMPKVEGEATEYENCDCRR